MSKYGDCTRVNPWTVKLQGPTVAEEDRALVFTPDFPCGVELNATLTNPRPLVTLAQWGGCVGDPAKAEHVLVQGHVIARDRGTVDAGQVLWRHLNECEPDVKTSEPRLKLKITACGMPGTVILDAESAIVIPAGIATIEIIGPATWTVGRGFLDAAAGWTDALVRVMACPLDPYAPKGRLTTWQPVDVATPQADRTWVRPRRAEVLGMIAATAAGAASNVSAVFGAGAAIPLVHGFTTWIATQQHQLRPAPCWPFLAVAAPAAAIEVTGMWGLE